MTGNGHLSFYIMNSQTWCNAEELGPSGPVDRKAYVDVLIDVISGQSVAVRDCSTP